MDGTMSGKALKYENKRRKTINIRYKDSIISGKNA